MDNELKAKIEAHLKENDSAVYFDWHKIDFRSADFSSISILIEGLLELWDREVDKEKAIRNTPKGEFGNMKELSYIYITKGTIRQTLHDLFKVKVYSEEEDKEKTKGVPKCQ